MRDLEVSIKEKWLDGTPVGGITHYNLICYIMDAFMSKCEVEIKSMYAVNNRDKLRPGVTQDAALASQLGEDSAQSMIFRRVHALIYLGKKSGVNTAIAVSWHQLGFTLGIGPNVSICENGCILGAEHIVSSYTLPNKSLKERKLPLDLIKDTVTGWANEYNMIDETGGQFIERMREVVLTHQDMIYIFGKLALERVKADLGSRLIENPPFAALNQTQLNVAMSLFAEERFGKERDDNRNLTGWDAMNYLNFALNPGSCDVPLILPQQYAITQTMLDYVKDKL